MLTLWRSRDMSKCVWLLTSANWDLQFNSSLYIVLTYWFIKLFNYSACQRLTYKIRRTIDIWIFDTDILFRSRRCLFHGWKILIIILLVENILLFVDCKAFRQYSRIVMCISIIHVIENKRDIALSHQLGNDVSMM